MEIEVFGSKEFQDLYSAEPCLQRNARRYPYVKWAKARSALIDHLSGHGVFDKTGLGIGKVYRNGWVEYEHDDFVVGEDWFESGALSLIILRWSFLTARTLQVGMDFLRGRQDYLVDVVKATPRPDDMLDLIVTASRVYMCLYGKTAAEAVNRIKIDDNYRGIRNLIK